VAWLSRTLRRGFNASGTPGMTETPPVIPRAMRRILSLEDLEPAGERFLPNFSFQFVSGGVETNASLRENRSAFQDYDLYPQVLNDVSKRTTDASVYGKAYSAPFGIAPMGGSGLSGFRADLAFAQAAKAENIPFILSGASLIRMEEIAEANPDTWFQAYLPTEREGIAALLDRVAAAKFKTILVTVDVPVSGNRENLVRAGFSSPLRPTFQTTCDALAHPRWLFGVWFRTLLRHGMPHYENTDATRGIPIFSRDAFRTHLRDSLTWRDLEWIRERWKGRLLLKGVLAAADARKAREIGLDGVIVSNHGGRQLDGAVAPLRALPEIKEAAQGMTVLFDGGIRRGTDVIKAMALGADFIFVGRPFLYAAALAGSAGVRHSVSLLRTEIHRDLALLGCRDLSEVKDRVRRR
jgi:L-lactate dehydrogenase (cytochrome)